MRRIKAGYIFGGITALKKLMNCSAKFGIDLYWNLFDYSLEIYRAHDKIMTMRQEIIKNHDNDEARKQLDLLADKEFEINFDRPVIKRSQIDPRLVTPDDLAILVNNQIVTIVKDEPETK